MERLRPTMAQVWMETAFQLSLRSTCKRLQVGAVITTADLQAVLGVGYNGNASGLANECDTHEAGKCGCIHAECNALIKSGKGPRDKALFTTVSPCLMCAKMIINSGFSRVSYVEEYRDQAPLVILRKVGIELRKVDRCDLFRGVSQPSSGSSDMGISAPPS